MANQEASLRLAFDKQTIALIGIARDGLLAFFPFFHLLPRQHHVCAYVMQ